MHTLLDDAAGARTCPGSVRRERCLGQGMPARDQILTGLVRATNEGVVVAALWHAMVGAAIIALALGWRPSARLTTMLLAAPLASVSASSLWAHNPFNASAFAVLALAFVLSARSRERADSAVPTPRWALGIGSAMIAVGWFYPHFLVGSYARYLYATPLGLIPCPTLAAVTGFALLGGGLRSRRLSRALVAVTAVYAVLGSAWLGVGIDAALLVGAAALLAVSRADHTSRLDGGSSTRSAVARSLLE